MILGIYGSGGLGREILDLARFINDSTPSWDGIVFINDFKVEAGINGLINGASVFTFDEFKAAFQPEATEVVIAVGEPKARVALRERVTGSGYALATLVHPGAFVGAETRLEDGVVVQYGSLISCNCTIGKNSVIQPLAYVGHDAQVGQDTVISSFVAISGACVIGDRVFIGAGVPVREKVEVGADSIVGIGATVLQHVARGVVAIGTPARPVKKNETGTVFRKGGA